MLPKNTLIAARPPTKKMSEAFDMVQMFNYTVCQIYENNDVQILNLLQYVFRNILTCNQQAKVMNLISGNEIPCAVGLNK